MDKTGTLTRNQPTAMDVAATSGHDTATVVAVAAALEASSDHPLAGAITAAASGWSAATQVHSVAGYGLTGTVDGTPVRVGKPGSSTPPSWASP